MQERAQTEMNRFELVRPKNRTELHEWIAVFLKLHMPWKSVCPHHRTPLDYLAHSFFEKSGQGGTGDAVVWACRGGGKTTIGAVATLLDMVYKPGIQIRILAGSFEQGEKMYTYLRQLLRTHTSHSSSKIPPPAAALNSTTAPASMSSPNPTAASVANASKNSAATKSNSSTPPSGRPPNSSPAASNRKNPARPPPPDPRHPSKSSPPCRGMPRQHSMALRHCGTSPVAACMQQILADPRRTPNPAARHLRLVRPGTSSKNALTLVTAETCPLWDSCQGRAKHADGFVPIEDVLAMKSRISLATWQHEMLCHPPRFENAVFPAFRRDLHLAEVERRPAPGQWIFLDGRRFYVESIIAGVDFGYAGAFVCLSMAILREAHAIKGPRAVWIFHELVTREQTVARNADAMRLQSGEVSTVYCDVAGRHTNSQTGRTDERVLRDAGFTTRCRPMKIDEGIGMIAESIGTHARPRARLFIDPQCIRLIAAFEGYRRSPDGKPEKDGAHDHLIDALRYAIVNHDGTSGKVEVRHY